uniref:Neurotrophin 1 n=1 Tax=Strongyloides papillosus TaxID=174720 RepID=A0A0N5BMF0_STREA
MQTGTRSRFALVLLFSLLIGLSFGANARRNGIGAAIVGGIVNTNKAIIGGITGTIGAVVDTAKESNNATEKEDKRASRSAYGWDDSSYTANKVDDNLFPQNLPSDDGNSMLTEMNGGDYGGAEIFQSDEQFLDVNVPSSTAETDVDVEGSGNLYEPVVVVNEEKSTFGEESSYSSAYGQGAELLPPSNANKLTYGSEMEGTVKEKKLPASGNKAVEFVAIYAVRRRRDSRRTKEVARNGKNRKSGSLNADAPVEQQRSRRDDDWDDHFDDNNSGERQRVRVTTNRLSPKQPSSHEDDNSGERQRVRVSTNRLNQKQRSRRDDDWDGHLDDDNSGERQRVRVPTNRLSPKQPSSHEDDNSGERQRVRVSANSLNQRQRSRRDDDWDDWFDDCDDADDIFDPECRARLNHPVQSQRNPVPVSPKQNSVVTNPMNQRGLPRRGDDWDDWMDDDCDDLDDLNDPECRMRLSRPVQQQRNPVPVSPRGNAVATNPLNQRDRPRRDDDWDDWMDDDCDDADDLFDPECRVRLNRQVQPKTNTVVLSPKEKSVAANALSQKDRPRRDDDWDDWMDDDCDDADDLFDPECRVRLNRQVQPKTNTVVVSTKEKSVATNTLSQNDRPRRNGDWDDCDDADDLFDPECRRRLNQRPASPLPPVRNPRPVPQQPPMRDPRPPVQSRPPMVTPRPVPPRPPMWGPGPVQPPMRDPRPPVQPRPPMVTPRPVQPRPPMWGPGPVQPPMRDPRPVPQQPPMGNQRPVPPRDGRAPAMVIREETRPVSPREGNVSATPMKDQRTVSPEEEQVSPAPAGGPQPFQPNNNQGHPRRSRRSVSEAVVGGVTETSKAVANGTEKVVDATTGGKKDKVKSKETKGTKKASKVGGITDTANSTATGVESTVDEAKKEVKTTTTTTSKPKETLSSSNSTCKSQNVCYGDSDCNGGRCVGAFVGTCNCNACFNFITCTSDEGCGGLKGACDMNTKRCNCQEAHRKLGYPNYFDALTKFCNHQSCDGSSNSCNGLPCTSGRCFC